MVLVIFKDDKGKNTARFMSPFLRKNLDNVKYSVLKRGFDYLAIFAGIPGTGKSTLAQYVAKYLDPTFNTKERICFTAFGKDGLLERTSNAKKGTSWVLDESFADLSTSVVRSPQFIAVINHLQLLRQKGLFIILCLPDFFSLSKNIAIFRSSHLFVIYHKDYHRGFFGAFGRPEKRKLYIRGIKYLDYECQAPNFRATFPKKWIADQYLYEKLKLEHLKSQFKLDPKDAIRKETLQRNVLVKKMYVDGYKQSDIAVLLGLTERSINLITSDKKNK